MPQIGANFQFTSRQPNFERDQFDTIAHMAACTVCDEGHKCYCLENQKTYEFTSVDSNGDAIEPNETTGYWHEFSSGGNGDVTGATIGSGASAQNVTKVGGVLKFPAYPIVPINKIKVDGESSDLSINEGRVVIPQPPVKGIKTNSGSDLTPNNGIVTLPPIPADQSSRIKKIEDSIAQMGNNQPIVIPPNAVELPVSTSNPDYIDYDSDTTYVMNIDGTQVATIHYPYVDNNNDYVAFKAIDRDLYYAYSVSVVNDAERYTYSNQYTWSTLPADAKSKFESGIYAIKQVINDDGTLPEKKWYKNIPSVFVDKNNFPLRTRRINETISSSVIDVLLVKNDRLNKIYRYAFNGISNAWVLINGGCYTKDDATTGENYTKYDAYFDRQPASNVSFDDSITQLSTQESPITNVQEAIQKLATKIYGYSSTLIITLIYSNGNRVANKWFDISSTFQGSNYDFSSQLNDSDNAQYVTTVDGVKKFKTNSNGECRIGLPIGATYNIEFDDIANFAKPNNISGIADSVTCNISASYTALSQSESVLIKVLTVNVSSSINPNNKKVYIDLYDNNNEIDVSKYYEITVNSAGLVSTVKRKNDNSDTYTTISDNSIDISQGRRYKVYLEDWEGYNAESTSIITSQNVNRIIVLKYTYLLSGTYILLNDIYNPLGYESCKVLDIDTTNNKIKIIKNVNGTEGNYWIYHKSNNGIYMYGEFEDISSEIELISEQNINTIFVGVGLRSQELNHASLSQNSISGTCALFISHNVTKESVKPPRLEYVNDDYDGQSNCDSLVGLDAPSYPIYDTIHSKTCILGNNTYNAFLPSYRQFIQIIANYDSLSSIFSIFGKSMFTVKTGNWAMSTYQQVDYVSMFINERLAKATYYEAPACNFLPVFSF